MRTQTYLGNPRNYISSLTASSPAVIGVAREGEVDLFVPAAPQKLTPAGLIRRIDWVAVGAGAFVYAVAFAAWVWLAR